MSANAWTAYLSETTMPALWRMWFFRNLLVIFHWLV